ncbi:MAG: peptidoglycan DD-metalloendopeptidase family protein [bacterium]|nr:peptidoglycan DD-metalloendopeptidase family protein [bacterium]MDE0288232.1 peptidoglycan DD-metalloendopeptidase family protein [bacterium]MDE0440296.1 peptidoglycan DD-metalloendopeptidase family protein [bacterium]
MRRRLLVGCSVALMLTASILPLAVDAQEEEGKLERVEQRIRDLRGELTSAQSERTNYVVALEEAEARMIEVRSELSDAEVALIEAEGAVLLVEDAVGSLLRRIRLLDAELAANQLDQRLTREQIREHAVELYMSSTSGIETVLFGSDDLKAGVITLEYNRGLLQNTEVLLSSLEILERQEVTRQDRLRDEQEQEALLLQEFEAQLVQAEEHKATVDAAREELDLQIAGLESLLAEIDREIEEWSGHIDALEAESKRLELEILRRQVREGRRPGTLAWPVGGPVTSPFGWRIHPIFGDRRLHTGIDLGSAAGASIHAAGNGTVILAGSWGGYGRTVVIDHGGGLSSLYAHQSSIAVAEGQRVLAGDVIGYIGCTGFCTGPHLHFEVREVGAPVDPMLWLPR